MENPPSYFDAAVAQADSGRDERPIFTLHGCNIYSSINPSRVAYELSNPPCEGDKPIYGLSKYRYRVAEADGQPQVKYHVDHIYDFKGAYLSLGLRNVEIVGKANEKRAFGEVKMAQGMGPSSFTAKDHFKSEKKILGHFKKRDEILWKDMQGNVVAVEKRLERDAEQDVTVPPQLEMKATLDEKSLDLLVTCWAARLWKEAEKDLAKPMTWKEFKETSNHSWTTTHVNPRKVKGGWYLSAYGS